LKSSYVKLFSIVLLCCLGLIVYSNSFQGSFHLDDEPSIIENPAISDLRNIKNIWSFWPTRFITYLSIAINYRLGGLNVFGYHVFNLLSHIITALLVWWLVLLTLKTPGMKKEPISCSPGLIAFFAAAVFLVHPIQTQPVNYIIQRAVLLAALFYIAALCLYVNAGIAMEGNPGNLWKKYYFSSLVVAILAMFSKEMAISLPLTIGLYGFYFFRGKRIFKWGLLAPFLIVSLIVPIVMLVTGSVDIPGMRRVGEPAIEISSGQYALTQLRVITTYLRLVFIPINLNIDYDYPLARSIFEAPVIFGLLLLLLLFGFIIKLSQKRKLIVFGIAWFFVALLPESSFLPIRDVIFEHRLYLPLAGFSLFLIVGTVQSFKPKAFVLASLCLLLAGYSISTYLRNNIWKDEITLWGDASYKSPQKLRPWNNLGVAYVGRGEYDRAIKCYNTALSIEPRAFDIYNNLGMAYDSKGEYALAIKYYDQAISIDPKGFDSYKNRGLAYCNKNDFERAISDYNEAIKIKPDDAEVYFDRGLAYYYKSEFNLAILDYNKAIEINPYYSDAYYNRGSAYIRKGDIDQAIGDYSKTIEIDSGSVRSYDKGGLIFPRIGERDSKIFPKITATKHNFSDVFYNRGIAYHAKGDVNRAIVDYSKALEIKNDDAEAYNRRGKAWLSKKEFAKALADFSKAESLGSMVDGNLLESLRKISNTTE
jgi:tetratricopeptide (TPR) repeat protein